MRLHLLQAAELTAQAIDLVVEVELVAGIDADLQVVRGPWSIGQAVSARAQMRLS